MKAGKRLDMSEKLLTGTYCMRGSRNFCQGGGGGGGVQARLPENSIFLVLNLFYSFTMVYFKQNYNFPRFQRGSNIFQGGGGGGSNFFQGGNAM